MEPEVSLPFSQESATGRYHEPHDSSSHPETLFLKLHFNIKFPSILRSPKWSFSQVFLLNLYAFPILPTRATCPHLSLPARFKIFCILIVRVNTSFQCYVLGGRYESRDLSIMN
jgi:hypothetical protein